MIKVPGCVTNMRLTLEILKTLQDFDFVLEVTGDYTGTLTGRAMRVTISEIALGTGRHNIEDLLLRGHPSERTDNPATKIVHVIAISV